MDSITHPESTSPRTAEPEWLDEAALDIVRGAAFIRDIDWFLRKRMKMSDTMLRMANDELLKKRAAQFCAKHLEKYFRGIRTTGVPSGRLVFEEVLWRYRNLKNELLNKSRLKSPFVKYRKAEPERRLREIQPYPSPTPDPDEPLEILGDIQKDQKSPLPKEIQQSLLLVPRTPEPEQSPEPVPTSQLPSISNEALENSLQTAIPNKKRPRRRPRRLRFHGHRNRGAEACQPSHSLSAGDVIHPVMEEHQQMSSAHAESLQLPHRPRQDDHESVDILPDCCSVNYTPSVSQLITELAERAERSETLQAENNRLESELRMASAHRRVVESTLRCCRDTYLAEGDSARNIGISSLATKCYAVVAAVEHIQLDTEYVYFKTHLARQSSEPMVSTWVEGPRDLRQQYEVLRS